jgi:hypothetical protein
MTSTLCLFNSLLTSAPSLPCSFFSRVLASVTMNGMLSQPREGSSFDHQCMAMTPMLAVPLLRPEAMVDSLSKEPEG